jgi:transcriptional regulator with GAF, ATPase, and Fis domain
MKEIFSKIRKVAPTDIPVLILGESGTGKELTALAIHERSTRNNNAFVPINCAAIPESLLEAELFGYERGAFTGAYTSKKGKFEDADGGTLFLDEIGELSPNLQAKLLRFLENQIVERIGATKGRKVNVRVIAATNCNIEFAIENGQFRKDLYYRLSAFPINLPPVRERGGDKEVLAKYFLKRFSREMGLPKEFTEDAITSIRNYGWPGNVREIINKVRKAIIMANDKLISPQDLDLNI